MRSKHNYHHLLPASFYQEGELGKAHFYFIINTLALNSQACSRNKVRGRKKNGKVMKSKSMYEMAWGWWYGSSGWELKLDMKKNNDADDDDGAKSHIEIKRFPLFPLTKTHNMGWFFTLFVNFKHFIAETRAFNWMTMFADS